jgi:chromosome segregation ATPase
MNDTPTFIDKTIDNYNNELTKACLREQLLKEDCQDLERELTAARAEIEAIMETLKSPIEVELDMIRGKIAIPDRAELDCIAQIKAITDQRDGLRSCIDYVSDQLHKVTEQRDRLAVALQKLADCDWIITPHDRMDAVRTIAREALQSLTTNPPTSEKI